MRVSSGGGARLLVVAAIGLIVATGLTAAAFRSQSDSAANSISAAPDFRAPAVTALALGKAQGGAIGFVKKGGAYFVYADVSDSGKPASGTSSVSADVSALTAGATAVALSGGSFSAGGQSYNYRSVQQTADAGLAAGAVSYSVATVDNDANSASSNWPAAVDNTPPFGADVQTANASGGTAGKAESGDTVTFSYSEPVEPGSILSGWDGSATGVVVRITTGVTLLGGLLGQGEGLQVFNAANSSALPLGAVDLKQPYVAKTLFLLEGTMTFGASGTPSTMSLANGVVTVVLGTHGGNTALTVGTAGTMAWVPVAAPYDRAANAISTVAANETGGSDREF